MIRYTLTALGYAMAAIDIVMMLAAPVWNLYVVKLRMKEILKNR